jgi:glyceraldehyde-3-phosphate dehydrogenase (NADP+)
MRMLVGGRWKDKPKVTPVVNPFDNSVLDTVPRADAADVEEGLATAVRGAEVMRRMPALERYEKLMKAARLLEQRQEDFGRTISLEEGKVISEGRFEASRAVQTLIGSAEEAKRLLGEVLPLDAAPGGAGKFGFTLRVPCGVVVAISPFNFPLNLMAHKVGPALAAGNAVIMKPPSDTPLSSLKLAELLLEAGFSLEAVQCITGPGGEIGDALCKDRRVRKITFTGSRDVGEHICHIAGIKRVTMELGSNSPLIVMDDADMDKVVKATVATGYANAGQVCISTQRVLADRKIYGDFLNALKPAVEALTVGNQMDEQTKMGPMVRERDAVRVEEWIKEAIGQGAKLVTGGKRNGAMYAPTIVSEVNPKMRISCEELFGPAVAVTRVGDIDEAIALANDSIYGLSAAIFTQNIDRALKFAREVDSGNLHINWGPQWRADFMPYGGLKESGLGKEGPKYAVQEMTEVKMVVVH